MAIQTGSTSHRPSPGIFLLLLCLLPIPVPAHSQSLSRLDILPENTDLTLRISDGSALMRAMSESPPGRLWNDPEMRPFQDYQNLSDTLIKTLILNASPLMNDKQTLEFNRDLVNLMKNEIIVAVSMKQDDIERRYYLLAEMDAPSFNRLRQLYRREDILLKQSSAIKQYYFQGVPIQETISDDNSAPRFEFSTHYKNTWIAGTDRQWLESCIVRLRDRDFDTPRERPVISLSLSNRIFREFFTAGNATEPAQSEEPRPELQDTFHALGLSDIRTARLEYRLESHMTGLTLTLEQQGEGRGVWKLFSGDTAPGTYSPGPIPEDILSCHVVRLDLDAFWLELPIVFHRLYPAGAEQFQVFQKVMSEMLGVDLYRDIVANTDTLFTSFTRMENAEEQNVHIWQLRQPSDMEKTLAKLFVRGGMLQSQFQDNLEILSFSDCQLYALKIPEAAAEAEQSSRMGEPDTPPMLLREYGVGVRNGDLIFGSLPLLRNYIEGSGNGAVSGKGNNPDSPLYVALNRLIPDNVSGYGYFNVFHWIRMAAGLLSRFLPTEDVEGAGRTRKISTSEIHPRDPDERELTTHMNALAAYIQRLRFDRLPSPGFISSFFGPSVYYYFYSGNRLKVCWEFHYSETAWNSPRRKTNQ